MSQPRRSKHAYRPSMEALEALNLLSSLAAGLSPRAVHLRPASDRAEGAGAIKAGVLPPATSYPGAGEAVARELRRSYHDSNRDRASTIGASHGRSKPAAPTS